MRQVVVESDIFPHCAGSSRVTVGGAVDVICGVKVTVAEGSAKENEYIQSSVEISQSCSNVMSMKLDEKNSTRISTRIADIIKQSVDNNCASFFPNLVIIPGKFYWKLHIDLLVMQWDGSAIDICSFATYNALKCTVIPKTEVFVGESGRPEDFEVCSDITDAVPFAPSSIPLCITSTKIADSVLVLDATYAEEMCSCGSITVAVSNDASMDDEELNVDDYKICGVYKNGGGTCLPEEILVAINHARIAGAAIRPHLDLVHVITKEEDRKYPDHPPVRVGLLA